VKLLSVAILKLNPLIQDLKVIHKSLEMYCKGNNPDNIKFGEHHAFVVFFTYYKAHTSILRALKPRHNTVVML